MEKPEITKSRCHQATLWPIYFFLFLFFYLSLNPEALADLNGYQADYLGWQIFHGLAKPIIFMLNFFTFLFAFLIWKYCRKMNYAFLLAGIAALPIAFSNHLLRTYLAYLIRWKSYDRPIHSWEIWILKTPQYLAILLLACFVVINLLEMKLKRDTQ